MDCHGRISLDELKELVIRTLQDQCHITDNKDNHRVDNMGLEFTHTAIDRWIQFMFCKGEDILRNATAIALIKDKSKVTEEDISEAGHFIYTKVELDVDSRTDAGW